MDPTEKMMAVTLMYRSTGYSAEASDWYWVKYLPNGKVDEKDTRKGRICLAAKSAADERHSAADGGDCTFFMTSLARLRPWFRKWER